MDNLDGFLISARFASQLKEGFNGEPWFGESLSSRLHKIEEEAGSPHELSRVSDLIQHLLNWRNFVIRKLEGDSDFDIELNSESDWTSCQIQTLSDWKELLRKFEISQERLLKLLQGKSDQFMQQQVPGKGYSYEHMMIGLLQHDAYHQGQIAYKWKHSQ